MYRYAVGNRKFIVYNSVAFQIRQLEIGNRQFTADETMSLLDQFDLDVQIELIRARDAESSGNAGKTRTAARRAVGYALEYWLKIYPHPDYPAETIERIRLFAAEKDVPQSIRNAALRLQARLNSKFESPSKKPVEDALMIILYIKSMLV